MDSRGFCDSEHEQTLCRRLQDLREVDSLTDLKIRTRGDGVVTAHQSVLAARFPLLEKILVQHGPGGLQMNLFSQSVVKAVVGYAYTGHLDISSQNVPQVFLLADVLACGQLKDWCVEFLVERRLIGESLENIWKVANVTHNHDLLSACLPSVVDSWTTVCSSRSFFTFTQADQLAAVLDHWRLQTLQSASLIRGISMWMYAAATKEEQTERTDNFKMLWQKVDLNTLQINITDCLDVSHNILHLTDGRSAADEEVTCSSSC